MNEKEKIERLEELNKGMSRELEKIKKGHWAWETKLYILGIPIAKTIRRRILDES